MSGPTIDSTNTNALFIFAEKCQTAKLLYNSDHTILQNINERSIQEQIYNRLEPTLRDKWLDKHQKYANDPGDVNFGVFADWIKKQAQRLVEFPPISTHYNRPEFQSTNRRESQSNQRTSQITQQRTQRSFPSQRSQHNFNSPKLTSRPQFSKEYNDFQRSRRFNETTNTSNRRNSSNISQLNSSHPSEFEQPLHNYFRESSPSIDAVMRDYPLEQKCAWCSAIQKPHKHNTFKCVFFKGATQIEKWKVVYTKRLCSICLQPGHYYKACKVKTPSCETCNAHHHPDLGCRKEQRISPNNSQQTIKIKIDNQAQDARRMSRAQYIKYHFIVELVRPPSPIQEPTYLQKASLFWTTTPV